MKNLFLVFTIIFCAGAKAQDTIIVYDLVLQDTSMILPVSFNGNITSDHSSYSYGSMGSQVPLPQTAPTTNLFTGSNFSDLAKADGFFNLSTYPARTCVRVNLYDTLDGVCTGMMVGPCFVLISASSITAFGNLFWFRHEDSIRVFPGFNNGQPQSGIPSSRVKKIYAFKSFLYQDGGWHNIALLELETSIGYITGWTGFGFNSNSNFFSNNIFHKFSYPADTSYTNPSDVYNGDTLYYNYGKIDPVLGPGFYGVNSNDANLIGGQDGSTFMHTDNFMEYYSVALGLFSGNYGHRAITNKAYYQMLNVLNNQACPSSPPITTGLNATSSGLFDLNLFPNPAEDEAILEFEYDPSEHYSLKIFNIVGQSVGSVPVENGSVKITCSELNSGVYFLHIQSGKKTTSVCRMLVEH